MYKYMLNNQILIRKKYLYHCFLWKHHFVFSVLELKQHPLASQVLLEIPGHPHSRRSFGSDQHSAEQNKSLDVQLSLISIY